MKKDRRKVQTALVMVYEFGINMLVPIVMCTLVGVWIGRKWDINWIVIPFFFLGAIAGYNNIYKTVRKLIGKKKESQKEQEQK